MFSIPFAERFLPRWAAVVVPALIWGFAHSTYPNQPFYIRGVEVGFAGILIGAVMLKADIFPLLVWHFTVDAVYTALLLLRSSNPYFVVSGAAASLVLLIPLLGSLVLYFRRGGFTPEEDLTNAATGSAPAPPHVEEPVPISCAPPRSLSPGRVAAALALALATFAAARFLLPRPGPWEGVHADRGQGRGEGRRRRVPEGGRRRSRGLSFGRDDGDGAPRARGPFRCGDEPRPLWRLRARRTMAPRARRHAASHEVGDDDSSRGRSGTSATYAPSTSTGRPSPWTRGPAESPVFAGLSRRPRPAEARMRLSRARKRLLSSRRSASTRWPGTSSRRRARRARRGRTPMSSSSRGSRGPARRPGAP